jgi:hypothetical protein
MVVMFYSKSFASSPILQLERRNNKTTTHSNSNIPISARNRRRTLQTMNYLATQKQLTNLTQKFGHWDAGPSFLFPQTCGFTTSTDHVLRHVLLHCRHPLLVQIKISSTWVTPFVFSTRYYLMGAGCNLQPLHFITPISCLPNRNSIRGLSGMD